MNDYVKEKRKIYREAHKEQRREYNIKYKKRNPERTKELQKQTYERHKEKYLKKAKERRDKIRNEILLLLGNKCCKCGFEDKRALQIDHVNAGGLKNIVRFSSMQTYYKNVLEEIINGSKEYQLLCANCNWIKRYENREVRRRVKLKSKEFKGGVANVNI